MRLAIMGPQESQFTPEREAAARDAIRRMILKFDATYIITGYTPKGGVSAWAKEITAEGWLSRPIMLYYAVTPTWSARGGIRDRNKKIVADCDAMVVIVVSHLPDGTGMEAPHCCMRRNPPHIKSQACWAGWWARKAGKPVEWVIL